MPHTISYETYHPFLTSVQSVRFPSYANEILHKEESYNYIVSNICNDTYGECPDFLTVDDIIKIKQMVVNAKNKYVKENVL